MNRYLNTLLAGASASVACSVSGQAQEALQHSLQQDRLMSRRSAQFENAPYSFRWRDLRTLASASFGTEYNTNVRLGQQRTEDDFIFRPTLDLNAVHPLGEANGISLFTRVGYSKYLENDDLDQFIVEPGTSLAFDLWIKDLHFNFHERFSYQLDPIEVGAVAGVAQFGGINNVAGVAVTWNLEDVILSGGYDFMRFISTTDESDNQNRSTHMFVGRAGFRVHPALTVGAEVSASPTRYDDRFHNDSVGYSGGGYAEWMVTEQMSLQPRAGYTVYTFSGNGLAGDLGNFDAYYLDLALNHRPTTWVTYVLQTGRSISPGIGGNISDVWSTSLTAQWNFIRNWPFNTSFFYDVGEEAAGLLEEKYDRMGFQAGVGRPITDHLSANLSYAYVLRTSDLPNRDYDQHRVTFDLTYRF